MRLPLIALAVALLASPLRAAEPPHVTVITKDGRHSGTLSIAQIELDAGKRTEKVSLADIAFVLFGDTDAIWTRQGKRIKGTIRADGWSLKEPNADLPLARADLRFIILQQPLPAMRKGQTVDA